jgi:hypothetical protein
MKPGRSTSRVVPVVFPRPILPLGRPSPEWISRRVLPQGPCESNFRFCWGGFGCLARRRAIGFVPGSVEFRNGYTPSLVPRNWPSGAAAKTRSYFCADPKNRNLAQENAAGQWLQDFHDRVRLFLIRVPALRECIKDIPSPLLGSAPPFNRRGPFSEDLSKARLGPIPGSRHSEVLPLQSTGLERVRSMDGAEGRTAARWEQISDSLTIKQR